MNKFIYILIFIYFNLFFNFLSSKRFYILKKKKKKKKELKRLDYFIINNN